MGTGVVRNVINAKDEFTRIVRRRFRINRVVRSTLLLRRRLSMGLVPFAGVDAVVPRAIS